MSDMDDLLRMLARMNIDNYIDFESESKIVCVDVKKRRIEWCFDHDTERFEEIVIYDDES